MTPTQLLLGKLSNVKKSGTGWSSRCPAHEDRRASLSIDEGGDGRALVHCHAGCTADAICDAVGLRVADLMSVDGVNINTTSRNAGFEGVALTLTPNGKPTGKSYAAAAEAVAALQRRHGRRSALWTYHSSEGEPVGVVVRWDLAGGDQRTRRFRRSLGC